MGLDRTKVSDLITGHINNGMLIGTSTWNGLDALRDIKERILDTTDYDDLLTPASDVYAERQLIKDAIVATLDAMGRSWDGDSFKINDWLPKWRAIATLVGHSGGLAMEQWIAGAKLDCPEEEPKHAQGLTDEIKTDCDQSSKPFNPNAKLGVAEISFEQLKSQPIMGVRNGNIRYGRVRQPASDAFDPLHQPFFVQDKQGNEWKAWMVGSGRVSPIGEDVVCHFDGQRYVFQFHGVAVHEPVVPSYKWAEPLHPNAFGHTMKSSPRDND